MYNYSSSKLSPVERERLRERDREARVKMTYEADQRGTTQDAFNSQPIFGEIVRVKSNDKERQIIERNLGRFDEVKHLLDQDLYGIDGQPPPSPAPSGGTSSSNSAINAHEFKKPNACSQIQPIRSSSHHHHHHHSSSQRGGIVKSTDGKPAYSGRSFYPGQPVTATSSSSNVFRSSGVVSGKGPPLSSNTAAQRSGSGGNSNSINNSSCSGSNTNTNTNSNSSSGGSSSITSHHSSNSSTSSNSNSKSSTSHEFSSKLHQSARSLPKLNCEPREPSLLSSTLNTNSSTGASQANVENILDEMTSAVRTPLTAIAATPRPKESESKFTFNPVSGKMESLSPLKPPAVDKSRGANLLKEILAPVAQVPISASVFKTGITENPISPFTSPSKSPATDSTTNVSAKSKSATTSVNSASTLPTAATSSSKTASTNLPHVKHQVVLSEDDSEDDDDNDDDDDDDDDDSEEENNLVRKPAASDLSKNIEPETPVTLESSADKCAMSVEEDRASSSSDDSEESDSGSDSEDSSSDSPSPPALPSPELPSQEDSKRWNRLKNFILPTPHGNSTPTPQTPQAGENSEKSKTDDSDSSTQKSQNASSSSSDSEMESVKSSREKPSKSGGRKVMPNLSSDDSSDDDDDEGTTNHRKRRKPQRRPSSASSCSSDDSDDQRRSKRKTTKGQPATQKKATGAAAANAAGNSGGGSNPNVNNPNMTVVGVVRPHQRRPPSPPAYESSSRLSPQTAAEERYGSYVQQQQQQQQRSLAMGAAPEPKCELPSHSDGDGLMGRVGGHSRLSGAFQPQHAAVAASAARGGKAAAEVSAGKAGPAASVGNQSTKSNKGRKPKSPAMASADSAAPVKKKRGRKRTKMPELSDSDDDEQRKAKAPERKRPGRPPLKRADPDDEWNSGPRRNKILEKFPASNVWGDSQRRRSSLRSSYPTINSDSDEQSMALVKPMARVMPAIKKKESSSGNSGSIGGGGCSSRVNRDSSCDSAHNDNDYNLMSSGGAKSGGANTSAGHLHHHSNVTKAEESPPKLDVEGIAVQDKKKSDTLRKLFKQRLDEGGGKGGGKGKGGKGKCGVIVMESETERKMLQRSMSPASAATPTSGMHRALSERLADIPRGVDGLPSPLQSSPRLQASPRVSGAGTMAGGTLGGSNKGSGTNGGGGSCSLDGDSQSSMSSRRQDRVPEMDSPNAMAVPTTPSTTIGSPISLPKLAYSEQGRPSLMCKIDLSRIPYIVAKKRSEEMRIRPDLPDTRQQLQLQPPPQVVDVPPSSTAPPVLDIVNVPVIEPMSNGEENDAIDRTSCSNNNCSSSSSNNIGCSSNNTSASSNCNNRARRLSTKKSKTAKHKHHTRDESPSSPLSSQIFKSSSAVHPPSVDPQSDLSSSDSEPRKKCKPQRLLACSAADSMHNLISPCYPMSMNNVTQSSMCVDPPSDDESWRSDVSSCISCSSSPMPLYGGHCKRLSKHHHTNRSWTNKRRNEHNQRLTSLTDAPSSLMHVPGGSYDRTIPDPTLNGFQVNISDLVRPVVPTHHGIYYSYLEHKASEEINSESDNVSPNVYLSEAKKLKYAADNERDRVAQGMKYLEAILSFLLTGHVLERKNQMDTAFSMYSETLKVIVYISSRFRQLSANSHQSSIPNKIAVLSLRCESILNLKLYTMRDMNYRDIHNTVNDYFSKPLPIEACVVSNQNIPSPPTPSPASSVGSNSSGYSSGDRRTSAMAPCIMMPVSLHQAIQKQHDLYTNLISSFNYWEEADKLIFSGGSKDFFIELDRFCGPLTLHSSLKDLVHYVRVGIQRLKAIISHHQRV